jgi:hypothetical protein
METPRGAARLSLFDEAVEALHSELTTRLAQLHTRKSEIGRLQVLADFLTARGWRARADVASHAHAGVALRLWVNVTGRGELTQLLRDFGGQQIEVARQDFHDLGDVLGYELTLADRTRVLLRVGVCYKPGAEGGGVNSLREPPRPIIDFITARTR